MLRLTAQLWALRARSARARRSEERRCAPIASFANYVARAAFNACHEWLRQRAPRRARLQSRVRYVLTHDSRLMMREAADRDWWCGTAGDRDGDDRRSDVSVGSRSRGGSRRAGGGGAAGGGRSGGCRRGRLRRSCMPRWPQWDSRAGSRRWSRRLRRAWVKRMCRRRAAVRRGSEGRGRMAGGRPAVGGRPAAGSAAGDPGCAHPSGASSNGSGVKSGSCQPRQRAALLLNLRDDEGRGMIELWPQTGIAPMAELAKRARPDGGGPARVVADAAARRQWIAERLGVTRRQVINLRKCARERLARRLRVILAPA